MLLSIYQYYHLNREYFGGLPKIIQEEVVNFFTLMTPTVFLLVLIQNVFLSDPGRKIKKQTLWNSCIIT